MRHFIPCLWLSLSVLGAQVPAGEAPEVDFVFLNFNAAPEGVRADELLAAWGVSFQGLGSEPRIRVREIFGGPIPQGATAVLRNEGADGAGSANRPLVITFARPVRDLILDLANGEESTRAELVALDALGREVVRQSGVIVQSDPFGMGTIGRLEAPAGATFQTVIVDYGSDDRAEEIDSLSVTFSERLRFRRCIAQIADGVLPDGGSLRTVIVLTNSNVRTRQVRASFRDSQGNPLDFPLDGAAASSVEFEIRTFNSRVLTSPGTSSPPVEGYACVESDGPVGAFALYQVLGPAGELRMEAGIDAVAAQSLHLVPAQRNSSIGLDTGFAVVNLSEEPATVFISLRAANGTANQGGGQLELGPGEHRAVFLAERFDPVPEVEDGTLVVSSVQPLAVTALRTLSGVPVSSLPGVSPREPRQYEPVR